MRKRPGTALPAALALAAGATLLAWRAPVPDPAPPTAAVLPRLGTGAQPICAGPEMALAAPGGQSLAPIAPVTVSALLTGAGQARLATPEGSVPFTASGPSLGLASATSSAAGPVRVDAGAAESPAEVSAVQAGLVRSGDQRGVRALACPTPAGQVWLVGGSTTPGHRGRLALYNPAAVAAVVDVDVLGPSGPVQAAGGRGVTVPPKGQTVLLTDALAPGLPTMAVHVTARTGRVAAVLYDSRVNGLVPGGVDDVVPAAPADRRLVIPGISLAAPAVATRRPGKGLTPAATVPARTAGTPGGNWVRVVNPGADAAAVRVSLYGETGAVDLPDGGVITVPPSGVADLPLGAVPEGEYTAVLTAASPVVAAALIGRGAPGAETAGTPGAVGKNVPPSDFGWAAATLPITGTIAVPAPQVSAAAGAAAVTLSAVATDGRARLDLVEVAADGARSAVRTIDLPDASVVPVRLAADTRALLLTAHGPGVPRAALVVTAEDPAGPMISVLPVNPPVSGLGTVPSVIADRRTGLA